MSTTRDTPPRLRFAAWHDKCGFAHLLVVGCLKDHDGMCSLGEICAGTSLCERTVKFVLVEMQKNNFAVCTALGQYRLVCG